MHTFWYIYIPIVILVVVCMYFALRAKHTRTSVKKPSEIYNAYDPTRPEYVTRLLNEQTEKQQKDLRDH